MTAEERAHAVTGTMALLMPEVYKGVRVHVLEMIRAAVAEERERCAKVADALSEQLYKDGESYLAAGATMVANAIRETE